LLKNPESNALDSIADFKLNPFSKETYVFTPNGDLKILPQEATALDFAYEIHTDIGNNCIGAKVNHKLVPISHPLSNGDQVEIITSRKQTPSEDWLNFVVTGRARSKIKQSLKEERRKVANHGKEILERKLKQLKLEFTHENLNVLTQYFNLDSTLDLYFKVANKRIPIKDIKTLKDPATNKLELPKKTPKVQTKPPQQDDQSINKGEELLIFGESSEKINYQFAKCCNPIPGDDVFGFITVNGEIKIHRTNCPNAVQLMSNYGYRVVKTKWTRQEEIAFLTGLRITGLDDVGVINKLTTVISGEMRLNMRSMSIDSHEGIFEGNIQLYVRDTDQLERLIAKLKHLKGIHSISRYDLEKSKSA
jgi:GTP pyrophosphokinase